MYNTVYETTQLISCEDGIIIMFIYHVYEFITV